METDQELRELNPFQSDEEMQAFGNDQEAHPVFSTSLVLRNIAQHLPVPDLVNNFSLVNKLWHNEARSFLRDKKLCTLAPGRIKHPEDMEAVLQLCRSSFIPFNRISLNCAENPDKEPWGSDKFGLIVNITNAMKLKCLHVKNCNFEVGSDGLVPISIEKLIAQILKLKWKTLEEISFGTIEYQRFGNEQTVPLFGSLPHLMMSEEHFGLPALHSLTFHCHQEGAKGIVSHCVLPILRISPALKYLNLEIPLWSLFPSPNQPLLSPEKLRLLTRFKLSLYRSKSLNSLKFLINSKVSCKRLQLSIVNDYAYADELTQLLPQFLHRSQNTLTALVTDVATIRVLQQADLLTLAMPNMRYLFLTRGERQYGFDNWEQIFEMFAGLTKSFPNLWSVTLNWGWDSCMYPAAKGLGIFKKASDSPRKSEELDWTVKRLIFRNCYTTRSAELFSILLPQLSHLSVNGPQDKSKYSCIFKFWPNLESLEFLENKPNRVEFEAMVCGISDSTVCDLRQITTDQLKQTVIAPSLDSIIAGLPNLRSLRVNVIHDQAYKKGLKCTIPDVSKYVAFARKKTLRVCYQYVPSSVMLGEEEAMVY